MMAGVQPGPCESNVISRMCGGKRFHVCRKLERWSVLNRSSRAVEGARYVGWAKDASDFVAWRNCFIAQMVYEGVQALWWRQELVRDHGRSGNWARDSEVLFADGTKKWSRSRGVGQNGLQRHS